MNWGKRYKVLGKINKHTRELAREFRWSERYLAKETASTHINLLSAIIKQFRGEDTDLRATMNGIERIVEKIQEASVKSKQRSGKIRNLGLELKDRKRLLKKKRKLAKKAKGKEKSVAKLEVRILEKTSAQVGDSLKGLKAKLASSQAKLKASIKDFKDENKAVKDHTKELGKLIKEFKSDITLLKKTNKELARKVKNKNLNKAMKELVKWIGKYNSFFRL